jgi:GntR family transcriptional repressor for pyruvate dehydrogenase complex
VEATRLAAERRSEEQADTLLALADTIVTATDDGAALLADWEFMAALVEAAGNLVFQLIMNSVRELYLPQAEVFSALVAHRVELSALYERTAAAVKAGDGQGAAAAIDELVAAQGAWMLG